LLIVFRELNGPLEAVIPLRGGAINMVAEKAMGSSSLFDVIDRILDRSEDGVIDERVSGRGVLMVLAAAKAGETDDMSGSDIEFICRTASLSAIREHINLGVEFKVTDKHFDEALQAVKERRDVLGE
jgi:AAA+ lid domain